MTTKLSQRPALVRVVGQLGALERREDALTQPDRVVDALEAGRVCLPFGMAEVRVTRAGRDDQEVIREFAAGLVDDDPPRDVHPLDVRHEHSAFAGDAGATE